MPTRTHGFQNWEGEAPAEPPHEIAFDQVARRASEGRRCQPERIEYQKMEINDHPLAYFLTWTTYGTWLPGDDRGWVLTNNGVQRPSEHKLLQAMRDMKDTSVWLTDSQRATVEQTISRHCEIRDWQLHSVNCRTNHVHCVIAAPVGAEIVTDQIKAWTTRRLNETNEMRRKTWWTEGASRQHIFTEQSLEQVIRYVKDCQD